MMNLENTLAHFYEVLVRMEVEPYETAEGAAVDLKRHRVLSVEPAMTPRMHDGRIVRSLKQGFLWRERVIRPEEVVVLQMARCEVLRRRSRRSRARGYRICLLPNRQSDRADA